MLLSKSSSFFSPIIFNLFFYVKLKQFNVVRIIYSKYEDYTKEKEVNISSFTLSYYILYVYILFKLYQYEVIMSYLGGYHVL